jgi:acyl-CoA synthetase (AMP-forming)/AMP-acid ligase II
MAVTDRLFDTLGLVTTMRRAGLIAPMRPDVVIKFMDQFGDVVYNNYNATEAGMIATATPQDLRAAPDTAGKPAGGTEIRVLDEDFNELPTGEVGGIYVRNSTQFDGYTSGKTKDFYEEHVRENLANYKVPRDITILDEMPRGSTGKIVRRDLQDRAARA